jgi:predicted transcriptional regulator
MCDSGSRHWGSASSPSAPPLYNPTKNAYINDSQPILEWHPSYPQSSLLKYNIQVDEFNDNWATLVTSYTTGLSETSWEISSPLTDGSYQWRVRADDGKSLPNSTSTWSTVWYFTIDTEVPSIAEGSGDFTTYTGKSFMIYSNFTDTTTFVVTSKIYYKKTWESIYKEQIMLSSTENKFYITNQLLGIDTSSDEDDYVYHIVAQDKAGNLFKYSNFGGADFLITVLDNVPPEILSGSGNFNTTTDDEFSIFVHCMDNIDLGGATLYIRKITDIWQTINLNELLSTGKFLINYTDLKSDLEINSSDGVNYEYFILVNDAKDNIKNYSNPSNSPWDIFVKDNDNPKIIEGSGNSIVTTGDHFIIYANFTDNIEVTTAKIFIKKINEPDSGWVGIDMTELSKNSFSIDYEDLKQNSELKMDTNIGLDYQYYILACDYANNICNYTRTNGKSWIIHVIDNDPPTLFDGSGHLVVSSDDQFSIYANFTDNVDVADAQIFIRHQEKDWRHAWMLKNSTHIDNENLGKFSITYDILKLDLGIDTSSGETLEYFIITRDYAGNQYNYSAKQDDFWEIIVVDNDPPIILNGSGNFSVMTGEHFTIYVDLHDNTEITSATLFYSLFAYGSAPQIGPGTIWMEFIMNFAGNPPNPEANYDGLEVFKLIATSADLNLDLMNNVIIHYFIHTSDNKANIGSYGSLSNPYKITIIDNFHPVFDSWSSEPKNLRADFNEDFIITVTINDVGGSGVDEQSVMIKYKRGTFDSTYHDYTNMVPNRSPGSTTLDLLSEWQFAIPQPPVDKNYINYDRIRYGWELISGEYLQYEIRCSDNEGNVFESGIRNEYIDPVEINHYPFIQLVTPIGNENLNGKVTIQWVASDFDNDELLISIELSMNNGESWSELVSNLTNNGAYVLDTTKYQNGNKYMIKVSVDDSELSTFDVSDDVFTIFNKDSSDVHDKSTDEDKGLDVFSTDGAIIITAGISIFAIVSCSLFIGGTEIGKYKFLTLIFVPLYSKLHHDNVLDHFTRGQIFGYVQAKPGEHYNTIKSALGLKNGTLSHHLKILEKEEFIFSIRDKFIARFYPKGYKISPNGVEHLNKFQETILAKIQIQPGIAQRELTDQLGASQQVISYNLTKLLRDKMLIVVKQGRENTYYLNISEVSMGEPQYQPQPQPQPQPQFQPQPLQQPITTIQPPQAPDPSQVVINQQQYQDQPQSITQVEPQIHTPNQPRLPPGGPSQVNTSESKRIYPYQE